jgi:hypothetical protein
MTQTLAQVNTVNKLWRLDENSMSRVFNPSLNYYAEKMKCRELALGEISLSPEIQEEHLRRVTRKQKALNLELDCWGSATFSTALVHISLTVQFSAFSAINEGLQIQLLTIPLPVNVSASPCIKRSQFPLLDSEKVSRLSVATA